MNSYTPFNKEQRLIHHLLLKSSFLSDLGLLNGKMGIVIFLFSYAKHTSNIIYEEIAEELLDEIWEEMNTQIPIDFESGLAGIGWGIEYLIQNKYVEGSGLEICEEIDNIIMKYDLKRITDLSMENGLHGLLYYVLIHIKNNMDIKLPFDNTYLKDLHFVLSEIKGSPVTKDLEYLSNQFLDFYKKGIPPNLQMDIIPFIENIKIDFRRKDTFQNISLGLNKGIAGYLFSRII